MSGGLPELAALPAAELPPEPWSTRLFTDLGTLLDAGVVRAMGFVVERALIPDPRDLEALRRSAEPLLDPALQAEPRRFLAFADDELPVEAGSRSARPLPGGRVIERRLEGAYVPYGAEGAAPSAGPIRVQHWTRGPGRAPATVLALHGFTMGWPRLDALALFASHWYRAGLDVALLTLPHHGPRTPRGARFSGEAFAVPHVARLGEAVREAVYEIGLVTRWLRRASGAPVGLLGLSLGGYLAALCAGLHDDLAFVVPMAPPVCMGDLAWRFFERTAHARRGGPAALTAQALRRAFRVHSPLAHPLRVPRERVLIVAGRGDRIVPPEHPAALWRHWREPALHWFSGSHLAPFGRGRIVAAVLSHLRGLGLH